MKTPLPRILTSRLSPYLIGCFTALAMLLAAFSIHAKTLDDFNDNAKTGWTDTLNGGSVTEASAQFTIATAINSGLLTSSKKTSQAFTNVAGHTLEFRVDVISVLPANPDTNALATLAWVPT